MNLPDKIRITRLGWNEGCGAYKVQIGDSKQTIAYVWVPSSPDDLTSHARAIVIAERICEGWTA